MISKVILLSLGAWLWLASLEVDSKWMHFTPSPDNEPDIILTEQDAFECHRDVTELQMTYLYPLGSDHMILPYDRQDFEFFCQSYEEALKAVIEFYQLRYPNETRLIQYNQLVVSNMLKWNRFYCTDEAAKQNFVRLSAIINTRWKLLQTTLKLFVRYIMSLKQHAIDRPQDVWWRTARFCCVVNRTNQFMLNAVRPHLPMVNGYQPPEFGPEVQEFLGQLVQRYFGEANDFICKRLPLNLTCYQRWWMLIKNRTVAGWRRPNNFWFATNEIIPHIGIGDNQIGPDSSNSLDYYR